jgi:hypothetical protein
MRTRRENGPPTGAPPTLKVARHSFADVANGILAGIAHGCAARQIGNVDGIPSVLFTLDNNGIRDRHDGVCRPRGLVSETYLSALPCATEAARPVVGTWPE